MRSRRSRGMSRALIAGLSFVALVAPRISSHSPGAGAALLAHAVSRVPAAAPVTPPSILLLFSLRSTAPRCRRSRPPSAARSRPATDRPSTFTSSTSTCPTPAWVPYAEALVSLLQEKYAGRRIDVVVTMRVEALRFLLAHRQRCSQDAPVVFADVTRASVGELRSPAGRHRCVPGDQGHRTVRVALDLHPRRPARGARRRVLAGRQGLRGVRPIARRGPGSRDADPSLAGLPLDEQLLRLSQLPPDSVVIFVSYRADSLGRSTVSRDVRPPRRAGLERPGLRGRRGRGSATGSSAAT